MIKVSFKSWLENQTLGGGLEPPSELSASGQNLEGKPIASKDYHMPDSSELPPINKKMKKKK